MPGEAEILVAAYKLAILTFYIGVLIYALPIPLPGLKRWAPALMADSILAAALVFIIYSLLDLSDYIASALGGSWPLYDAWYNDAMGVIVSVKAAVAALYSIPDPGGVLSGAKILVAPVDKAATAALLFLLTVGGIHLLIYTYGPLLAAVGVALYSVPFRVLRGAGAWLISFILVFNAGLQVLPVFLATVASAPGSPIDPPSGLESGVVYREIRVLNVMGDPIRGGLLVVYNSTGGRAAAYPVDGEGYARSSSGDRQVSLPEGEVMFDLISNAVSFPLEPDLVDTTSSSGEIVVWSPHIFWSPGTLQYAYTIGEITGYSVNETHSSYQIELYPGEFVEIRYPQECPVQVEYQGLEAIEGETSWEGVDVVKLRLKAVQYSIYNITLYPAQCNVDPGLDAEDYLSGPDGDFVDYNILAAFILYYFTVPMIYIFTLFIATTGLARLLGGRDRIPVRVV